MSEQPVTSTAEGSFNVDLRGVHYDFLKDRVPTWFTQASSSRQEELASHEMELPSWYLTATAQEKTALAQSHTRYRETLNQVENTLGDIKDVLAFAEQPLKDAIKKQFNLDLDVKNVYFARKYGFKGRDDLLGAFVFEQRSDPSLRYEYRGVSLLEAALANFAPDEARAGACNDCQIITTWNAYDGEIIPTFSAVNSQALPIAPHEFAQLCRNLDLGKLYQEHIKAIVQPQVVIERTALHQQLQEHQRQLLALSAEVAAKQPQWGISVDAYRMIKQVITDPGSATLDGKPVTFAVLKVFGNVLAGPLLIGPARKDSDRTERLLVYIPNDPQQPLKEYASSGEFMADLRTRLHSASYRRFFSRFVPQGGQGFFFQHFNRLYKPANGKGAGGDYPLASKPVHLPLDELYVNGNLWEQLRETQVRKILADARAVAVPTDDEDRKARMDRLASFADAVISVFNLGAFVVPGLGPIMLAVGAAQMCTEVYEGIEAYEQGDLKTMWAHFSSVALNAAMLVTGAKVLPAVKWVSSIDPLKPVTLPNGKQVLWKPDLTPYKVPPPDLPPGAKPDTQGLYQHNGQTVLPHEGDHYQVRQEPDTGQYRIQHPSRAGAYEPQLEHNHAGAWSHEVEAPLTWDKPTLMRRLGLNERGLDTPTLEQARIASGVEEDTLRQTFVEHERVPLLLEDTIEHFKAHQELTTFVEQMRSSDPAVYAQADPALQMQMMQRRGMLPVETRMRVMSSDGRTLWEDDAPVTSARRVVVVTQRQLERGEFLKEVLNTLQGVDPTLKEIPGEAEDTLEVRAGKLRKYLGDTVQMFKGPLVEERYKASTVARDPDLHWILASYPKLPTSMAAHLLKTLGAEQRLALRRTGLLPEAQAEQARWCEQETRVSRAYEGLHLDTLASIDSQRLALRSLEALPGWPRGTRVELRQYSAEGLLLDAIGSPDWPQTKVLVQMDNGLFEAQSPRDFYTATWEALSTTERQGLEFTDAQQLKAAIQQAPLPREPLRTVLLEHPVRKPAVDPTLRLLGGGRGFRQLLGRVLGPSEASIKARVRTLYRTLDEQGINDVIQSFGTHVERGLKLREAEFNTVQMELAAWVKANTPQSGRVGAFDTAPYIARTIMSHWRREASGPLQLIMGGLELPILSADFSHVEALELHDVRWSDSADAFLRKFTHVNGLSISRSRLTELPRVVGDMIHLTSLSLHSNHLRLTPQSARVLGSLGNLEELYLANNALRICPDFSSMARLRNLNLRNTQLEQWPTGLDAHTDLNFVDLSDNLLREVPEQYLNPADEQLGATARLNGVTLLEGNPFPADYWQHFDDYWRRLNQALPDLVKNARKGAFDSGNPKLEKMRRLYPNKRMQEARALIWSWGAGADAELARLELEFNTVERQLDAWTFSGGGERQRYVRANQRQANAGTMDHRYQAQNRILACWRRETPQMLAKDGTPIGLELDLSDLNLPSLPDLDVDFSHVGSLKLNNMGLSVSPEGFLARYRHLRWLEMANNRLTELPPALGEMHGLTRLTLNDNQIRLTADTARILSERVTLRALWLHNNSLGITPDFSRITDMRSLSLINAGIDTWPVGLLEQPLLDQVALSHNALTTIPDAVIAPSNEQLAQAVRVNSVTTVSGNPFTAQTLDQVRAYNTRLEGAGLVTPGRPNRLGVTALETGVMPGAPPQAPFLRWTTGLPADQVATRSTQWARLHGQPDGEGFFNLLNDLDVGVAEREELQRRVWEVIDGITENSAESEQLRKDMFEWAGKRACCDRAALTFSNLEILLMVHKAKALALTQGVNQGVALTTLARGLFRLDEVEAIALRDIDQRRTAINNQQGLTPVQKVQALALLEEVEIRLAYRHGLKDRLDLPGQPQHTRFTGLGNVTPAMLEDAYQRVISRDNSVQEFDALVARDFWKDYVTNKHRNAFEAQNEPYQKQLAQLQRDFESGKLSKAVYDVNAEQAQSLSAVDELTLIETLTRQEIAQARVSGENLEALVERRAGAPRELLLSEARAIEFEGRQYFVASMPDGDGEHYVLWVQAPDNPYVLVSSGVIAKPDIIGVWKRQRTPGGMKPESSGSEYEDAPESMPMLPYTADELSLMRQEVHFTSAPNRIGSYNRANNGKYPLRDYQGRPIRIRKLQKSVELASGVKYTSDQIKPFIKFEGYEEVGARYEEKLQRRSFTAQDMKVPEEKSLIGQNMVVANRLIAKGEIVGVYGGTVLPSGFFGPSGQTYTMLVSPPPALGGFELGEPRVHLSGDNILSRINTNFEYDANGQPVRQAAGGYNVEGVAFPIEADMLLGVGPGATTKRKNFILTAVFATENIPAGVELRIDYQYTEAMIKTQFA